MPTREEVKLKLADGLWPTERWKNYMAGREGELWEKVSELVVDGKSLPQIAIRHLGIPAKGLKDWVFGDAERLAKYKELKLFGAELMAHETVDIADAAGEDEVAQAALRCKWRAWLAGKIDPATYGERLDVKHSGGAPTLTIVINEAPAVETRPRGAITVDQVPAIEQEVARIQNGES